jgi:hypothetical protein
MCGRDQNRLRAREQEWYEESGAFAAETRGCLPIFRVPSGPGSKGGLLQMKLHGGSDQHQMLLMTSHITCHTSHL